MSYASYFDNDQGDGGDGVQYFIHFHLQVFRKPESPDDIWMSGDYRPAIGQFSELSCWMEVESCPAMGPQKWKRSRNQVVLVVIIRGHEAYSC